MSLALYSLSHCRTSRFPRVPSASLDAGLPRATSAKILPITSPRVEETPAKALEKKNEISISTYDTAWVAMVPSPFSSKEPCFSDSLYWLLENQCHDGSWARPHHHSLLKKDVLSSTLASVLALKIWGVGQQHIDKGLHFLESNFGCAADESQVTPTGFEVIFPAMLDRARDLSLNPVLEQTTLNHVMSLRDLELKRINSSTDKEAYMAYIGEGLLLGSTDVMKYQRKNGSLFDSPSSTVAAFTASGNSRCLSYLNLVVNEFGGAVPAVYPLDIYPKLRAIGNLEKWGISRYFTLEIRSMLDQAYRCWMKGDEEIFKDASTCALAFKLLRKNGYNVTSDDITRLIQEQFPTDARGLMTDINTSLELFRASEHMLYPHETELEKQNSRLRSVLEHELSNASIKSPRLNAEVKHALDFPFYAILERMATRKNIEHFDNLDDTRMLKTSYCLPNLGSKELLLRSVEDFNRCQALHREEFIEFGRWFVEHRLDQVDLLMNKFVYCYFTAAATFFAPELADARMSWAKNAVMIAITDDLYDVKGSYEEKAQLIELLQIWDVDMSTVVCSKDVEICFLALKSIIVELDEKGSNLQGRSLITEGIDIWVECLNAYMQEVEWGKVKYVPTFDEYLDNAYVSFGLGPIVKIPIYLVGPKISEEMVNHPEYHDLFRLMSTCGRLVNDITGCERESEQGKVSGVPLYIAQYGGGEMSTEAAISEILCFVGNQRRQMLGLVSDNCTVFPKAIKELYWHMTTVNELFFKKDDGFWSKELTRVAHHIIQEPIVLDAA